MDPDLMHPSGERSAENYTRLSVKVHPFKLRPAFFTVRRDFANTDLVADHFNRLTAFSTTPEKGKFNRSIGRD